MSYTTKVYKVQGGGELVISDGGKVTIQSGGALEAADNTLASALLAQGVAGATGAYSKTTDGAQTLLASRINNRVIIGIIKVTEAFAQTTGTKPVFTIGETDAADKFVANTLLASAALDSIFSFAGTLTGTKNLIVTGTPATGDGTGAISVTVLALPVAS